jgi:phenylpropionate dioxygenase-like ring-hydroxylating dioxygenase large terminal subunit
VSELCSFAPEFFDLGDGRLSPDARIMSTGRVASYVYFSDERFEAERQMFRRLWLNVADAEEISKPGDWVVKEIPTLSTSVLITRAPDGGLRAFHNVCLHRGMKVVCGETGNAARFSCPYHGWTYGSDGGLRTIPDADCFPHVDQSRSGLKAINLEVWEGFVFVNLATEPAQSLAEFLAPVTKLFQDLPFKRFPHRATITQTLNCNWKLALEAQSESYHIRALHARTVSSMLSTNQNPFCHPLYWFALGPHRTWSTAVNPGFTLSAARPVQSFAFKHAGQVIAAGAKDSVPAKVGAFHGPTPLDRGDPGGWGADNLVLFPHLQLNAAADGCWLHRFWPLAPDRTAWEAVYYYRTPDTHKLVFGQEYSLAFNRDTLAEDNGSTALQQASLKSGAISVVQFGEQEMMCRHLEAVIEAVLQHGMRPTRSGEATRSPAWFTEGAV